MPRRPRLRATASPAGRRPSTRTGRRARDLPSAEGTAAIMRPVHPLLGRAAGRQEPGGDAVPALDLAAVAALELRPHSPSLHDSDDEPDLRAAVDLRAHGVA